MTASSFCAWVCAGPGANASPRCWHASRPSHFQLWRSSPPTKKILCPGPGNRLRLASNQTYFQRSNDVFGFNLAVAADPAQVAVAGIERILQAGRIGARRGRVNRRRRYLAQRLMRPLVIELVAEVIEAPLLGSERGGRRLGGFCLEGLVHAFMPPVLLGLARHNAHWGDAQLEPPHRQPAQAAGGQRGERRTIIGGQFSWY